MLLYLCITNRWVVLMKQNICFQFSRLYSFFCTPFRESRVVCGAHLRYGVTRGQADPLPEFSSRGAKNQKERPKTRRVGTFLKYSIGYMQQPVGQTWNGGTSTSNGGPGHHWRAGDGPGDKGENLPQGAALWGRQIEVGILRTNYEI